MTSYFAVYSHPNKNGTVKLPIQSDNYSLAFEFAQALTPAGFDFDYIDEVETKTGS